MSYWQRDYATSSKYHFDERLTDKEKAYFHARNKVIVDMAAVVVDTSVCGQTILHPVSDVPLLQRSAHSTNKV